MRHTAAFLLIGLTMVPLTACARSLSGDTIEGKVLEQVTNKPIPGAIVVARWEGHVGYTGTVCYHVESAITDERGVYRTAAWKGPSPYGDINYRRQNILAYKLGYEWSTVLPKDPLVLQYLKPFTGTRGERFQYLFHIGQSIAACRSPEAGQRNLAPLYRALYEEAKSLAKSREELDFADGFLWQTEYLDLGPEEADKRDRERTEQKDRRQMKRDSSALEGIIMKPSK